MREISPRELAILVMLKNTPVYCSIQRIPLFSLMDTNSAISITLEYRLNTPNFALAIPFNLFYKNPGEMQNKK